MSRQQIEDAILAISCLLEIEQATESDFQHFFETNEIVFSLLGFSDFVPHARLVNQSTGEIFIPDFLVKSRNKAWEIFEIKTPSSLVVRGKNRREQFYAEFESYVSQCAEYSEYFDDSKNRDFALGAYGLRIGSSPFSTLVSGRNDDFDKEKVCRLLSRRTPPIKHVTYDDIRDLLVHEWESKFGFINNLKGVSIFFVVKPIFYQEKTIKPISDFGFEEFKNRIFVFFDENDNIKAQVFDVDGEIVVIESSFNARQNNEPILFCIEVGFDVSKLYLSIRANNKYILEYKSDRRFGLSIGPDVPVVIGSNNRGTLPTSICMRGLCFVPSLLKFQDRSVIEEGLLSFCYDHKKEEILDCYEMEMIGNKFLHSSGHPNFSKEFSVGPYDLIQHIHEKKPILRKIGE